MILALAILVTPAYSDTSTPFLDSWTAPPETVWAPSNNNHFELLRHNRSGLIEIFKKGKRDQALWSTTLAEFNQLFSKVYLVNNGTRVVHIRGNHIVNTVNEVAVRIVDQDGSSRTFKASLFVDELAPGQPVGMDLPMSPKFKWFHGIVSIENDHMTIINARGKHVRIDFE